MGKFNTNNKNNGKKENFRGNQQHPKKFVKPNYVKKNIKIAYSDFYGDVIDSLYNLLSEISWSKISIPVKMYKSEFYGDDSKGTMVLGNVVKFNNDNTFTISVSEDNAKAITDKSVMVIKCYRDKTTNEINYVAELTVSNKYDSIDSHYSDIEKAFTDSEEESEK